MQRYFGDFMWMKSRNRGCSTLAAASGASLRSFARRLPHAHLLGLTLVPWQVERANALNEAAGCDERVRVIEGHYETRVCHAAALTGRTHSKAVVMPTAWTKAHYLRRPTACCGRADVLSLRTAFSEQSVCQRAATAHIPQAVRVLGDQGTWPTSTCLRPHGSAWLHGHHVEHLQLRVAPSVAHIPWVTLKFLLTDVAFGTRKMTRARWNNVLAPVLLPLVSAPLGPMTYCMVTATKR